MKPAINHTHDPSLRSWLPSANRPGCDFPIQNLPFGVFMRRDRAEAPHIGVAIGDAVLDLAAIHAAGLLSGEVEEAGSLGVDTSLNRLMGLGREPLSALRERLSHLLREGNDEIQDPASLLIPMAEVEMLLPASIGDYTDFYASIHHATHVGTLLRPDNPLLPNYKHVPIGYHGRSSSIVVSGTEVRRPRGQRKDEGAQVPEFVPSRALDYEVELGLFVGPGNPLGEAIGLAAAEAHLFGVCLLNDWSARDVQKWEYQPLGPFLGKSFATTISPWVVTMEALEPYRRPSARPLEEVELLPYLIDPSDRVRGALDITVDLFLSTARMRAEGHDPARLSRSEVRELYWTPAQLLTHHTSNGCNLRPGDLLGTGTISGSGRDAMGCLLELTSQGKVPIVLPNGEERRFLADGDEVIMVGSCEAPGFVRLGLGSCSGRVLPAG